jgi:hypothetical protein
VRRRNDYWSTLLLLLGSGLALQNFYFVCKPVKSRSKLFILVLCLLQLVNSAEQLVPGVIELSGGRAELCLQSLTSLLCCLAISPLLVEILFEYRHLFSENLKFKITVAS